MKSTVFVRNKWKKHFKLINIRTCCFTNISQKLIFLQRLLYIAGTIIYINIIYLNKFCVHLTAVSAGTWGSPTTWRTCSSREQPASMGLLHEKSPSEVKTDQSQSLKKNPSSPELFGEISAEIFREHCSKTGLRRARWEWEFPLSSHREQQQQFYSGAQALV